MRKTVAPAPSSSPVSKVAVAAGVELAQIAGEAGFIAGTAFTMCAITLAVSNREGDGCGQGLGMGVGRKHGRGCHAQYKQCGFHACNRPECSLPDHPTPCLTAGPGHGLRAAARGGSG